MSEAIGESDQRKGYQEVKIGPKSFEVPKEWDIATIPTLCNLDTESFDASKHGEETFEYIDIESVSKGTIDQSKTIPVNDAPSRAKQIINTGDTLVGKVRPYLQAFAPVTEEHDGKVCSTGFAVLSAREGVSSSYITQAVLSKYFLDQMTNRMTGTSYPAVNKSDFKNVRLFSPPLPEQRRIADILSTVDEQVQQTDEIIEEKKKLKQGLMQDLLHKGIGHDEFKQMHIGPKRSTLPVDWDVVQLGEIADIQSGSTPKRSNAEYWDDGTIPWIKSGEFNDRIVAETEEYITEKALEETGCVVFPKGTLLIALYGKGTVSKTARLGIDAATNQAIAGLLPESGAFNPRYLQYYLIDSRDTLLNVTVNPSSDTGRTNIYMSALRQFKVALPPLEEQEAIADRIAAVDDKITDEVKYKQHLQDLKRGLMQDFLTGKVRVNID